MNIFHKVTLQSLRKNKTRTIVTIIGIMLSAALICAVTTSVASFFNYTKQNVMYVSGSWHAYSLNETAEAYEELCSMDEIDDTVYAQQLGFAEIDSMNEFKPYLYILGAGEGFEDMLPIHLISGRFPDNTGEIILPEHLEQNGGVDYRIGDVLTLDIGDRLLDGDTLYQTSPCYIYTHGNEVESNGELLNVRESRTYTVVGFYERPVFEYFQAPGYTALTAADADISDDWRYDIYYTVKHPKDIYTFIQKQGLSSETHDELLQLLGAFRFKGANDMIYGLAAIFIGLIMFGSIALIYNAFAISVSERTKQFGLLSSVGATKKQLRRMVLFEALVVGTIGIIAGILLGIAGIGVTLHFIGHKFSSLFEYDVPMRICVSPAAIVIACAVAMLTVLISAWIPSKRATRVSAVEAVRQSKDIKAEKKPVRTPKIVYKLFGLSGMLAHKHYKRSKKKYRATVMSLFMSIVLFISASAFTDYLMGTVSESFSTYGYDLRFYLSSNDIERISPEEVLELIEEDEYVDGAAYTQVSSYICSVPVSSLSEDAVEMMHLDNNSSSVSEAELETTIYFLKDETFRELLEENNLSEDKFMNPEAPLAVAVDGSIEYDPEQEKYFNINYLNSDDCEFSYNALRNFEGYYFAGGAEDANGNLVYRFINQEDESDYMELSKEEATFEIEMKSGKTIYEKPFYISDYAELILIYPHSVMESVVSGDTASYSHVFLIKSEQHTQCSASLKKNLYENRITSSNLYDYAAEVEEERNIITIIKVFAYGFIILISLIAAANVFNTISTNISLRRREFAMLKSIGMTNSGFNKMMNYECILYGTKALLLGLPASFGVTYLIHKSVIAGYNTVFRLPWGAVGIAVLSVFAVVFATMLYSMSKVKKDNPIDALKNENI